jgi:hypothetical protein
LDVVYQKLLVIAETGPDRLLFGFVAQITSRAA